MLRRVILTTALILAALATPAVAGETGGEGEGRFVFGSDTQCKSHDLGWPAGSVSVCYWQSWTARVTASGKVDWTKTLDFIVWMKCYDCNLEQPNGGHLDLLRIQDNTNVWKRSDVYLPTDDTDKYAERHWDFVEGAYLQSDGCGHYGSQYDILINNWPNYTDWWTSSYYGPTGYCGG